MIFRFLESDRVFLKEKYKTSEASRKARHLFKRFKSQAFIQTIYYSNLICYLA
jgi:hypothetical protein